MNNLRYYDYYVLTRLYAIFEIQINLIKPQNQFIISEIWETEKLYEVQNKVGVKSYFTKNISKEHQISLIYYFYRSKTMNIL